MLMNMSFSGIAGQEHSCSACTATVVTASCQHSLLCSTLYVLGWPVWWPLSRPAYKGSQSAMLLGLAASAYFCKTGHIMALWCFLVRGAACLTRHNAMTSCQHVDPLLTIVRGVLQASGLTAPMAITSCPSWAAAGVTQPCSRQRTAQTMTRQPTSTIVLASGACCPACLLSAWRTNCQQRRWSSTWTRYQPTCRCRAAAHILSVLAAADCTNAMS